MVDEIAGHRVVHDPPVWQFPGAVGAADIQQLRTTTDYDRKNPYRLRARGDILPCGASSRLRAQVSKLLGLSERYLEPMRVVEYSRVGDTFEPHVDWIADEQDSQLAVLGQRVATGLLYLTDIPAEAGGATVFPKLGLSVQPRAGQLLLWPNVDGLGTPLPDMEHEACPLSASGVTKAAVNIWARDRPLPTDPAVLSTLFLS